MSNRNPQTVRRAAVVLALAFAATGAARAQFAPMDMSWAMQSQMSAWNQGQAAANAAAMQYLQQMRALRASGYTGPSLPTGVTHESLRASINGANAATEDYIRAQSRNSARQSAAVHDYSMQAIRGCRPAVDQYGRFGYVC